MKLAIFAHCTIDEISLNNNVIETAGGPACYCGLTVGKMKFDVELHTKVGPDFAFLSDLESNGIFISKNSISSNPTTRFLLKITGTDRNLYLKAVCDQIEFSNSGADGVIISPVFNEVSEETLDNIKEYFDFVLLDPQGYLRRVGNDTRVYLEKTLLDLSKISAIKTDPEEAFYLTGLQDKEAMIALQKKGVSHVLYTNKQDIAMLTKDRLYHLQIPGMQIADTTGVGDIFCAAFACAHLKERDALWAICFAVGAAQASLESRGIGLSKVPHAGDIERNAAYLYNLVKFSQV